MEEQQAIVAPDLFPLSYKAAVVRILQQVVPFAASRVVISGGTFVTIMILSKMNHDTLGASSLTGALQSLVISTSSSLLYSTGILIGKVQAEGELQEVGNVFQKSLLLSALISLPAAGVTLSASYIFRAMGQPPVLTELVKDFAYAYVGSIPAILGVVAYQEVAQALAKPLLAFSFILTNTLLTVGLSYSLVLGRFRGLSQLGISGLGYANLASAWITFIGGTLYFKLHPQFAAYGFFDRQIQRKNTVGDFIAIGLPIALQVGAETISMMFATVMVGWIGRNALAAEQVATQYLYLISAPLFTAGQAIAILVSQVSGQQDFVGVQRLGYTALTMTSSIALGAAVIFCTMPNILNSAFIDIHDPRNADIIKMSKDLFIIHGVGLVLDTVRSMSAGALRGFLDTNTAMVAGIVGMCAFALPLGYALGFPANLGLNGIFIARDAGMALGGVILLERWCRKSKYAVEHGQLDPSEGWWGKITKCLGCTKEVSDQEEDNYTASYNPLFHPEQSTQSNTLAEDTSLVVEEESSNHRPFWQCNIF